MRSCCFVGALVLALAAGRLAAQEGMHFSVAGGFGGSGGTTSYVMNEPGDAVTEGVKSELVFPLDGFLAGGSLALEGWGGGAPLWLVRAGAYTNLTRPYGVMADSDWYLFQGFPPTYFSYTESSMSMLRVQAFARAAAAFFRVGPLTGLLQAGYRLDWIEQTAQGYIGWYYYWNTTTSAFDLYTDSYSGEALYYRIIYHLPSLELAGYLRPWPPLSLFMWAGYVLAIVSDYDDHLLRSKLSTASGVGSGACAGLEARLDLGPSGRPHPYLGLDAEVLTLRVDTRQRQVYYDGSGVTYNVSHLITSLQGKLIVTMGMVF